MMRDIFLNFLCILMFFLILLSGCSSSIPSSNQEDSSVLTCSSEKLSTIQIPSDITIQDSGVPGLISKDTTWSGTINVDSVEVAEGITLTILPGTVIKFKPWRYGYSYPQERGALVVRGTLKANGTADKPIRFTSDAQEPRHKDWQGIVFFRPSHDNIVDHCIIEYSHTGIFATDADFTISNSIVRWNGNIAWMRGSPMISNNRIYGGMYGAIEMEGDSYPTISNNTIWGTVNGIFVSGNSHAVIRDNIIKNVTSDTAFRNNGIFLTSNSSAVVERNKIISSHNGITIFPGCPTSKIILKENDIVNNDMNLNLFSDDVIDARRNWWGTIDKNQIKSKIFQKGTGNVIFEPFLENSINKRDIYYDFQNCETYNYEPYLNSPRITSNGIGTDGYVYLYPDDKTRSVLTSWGAGESTGFLSGIAWDGHYLWVSTFGGPEPDIRKFDTAGNLINVIPAPGPWPYGLTFDGKYLWCLDYSEAKVYQLDTSGKVIRSINAPGKNPMGLTFDGKYLWTLPWDGSGRAIQFDTKGNIVNSIETPGWSGLAWDGEHLWVSRGEAMRIYEMDPSDGSVIRIITSAGEKTWGMTSQDSSIWVCEWANEIELDQRIIKLQPLSEVITIDGRKNEWTQSTLLNDPKGDAPDSYTDIKAFSAFTDTDYLYVMVETYADRVGYIDYLGIEIDTNNDQKPEYFIKTSKLSGIPKERAWGIGAEITQFKQDRAITEHRTWDPFLYALSNKKDVIECKVPLSFIENNRAMNLRYSIFNQWDGKSTVLDGTGWSAVS